MNGMGDSERERYATRLGFKGLKQFNEMFYGTWDERMAAIQDVDFQVMASIFSYSPTLSWLTEPMGIIASIGDFDTGGRHKSVEETLVSMPSLSFIQNVKESISGTIDIAVNDDAEWDIETANRIRATMPANSHPFVQYVTNAMLRETETERSN